jgi:hypothetical protein
LLEKPLLEQAPATLIKGVVVQKTVDIGLGEGRMAGVVADQKDGIR